MATILNFEAALLARDLSYRADFEVAQACSALRACITDSITDDMGDIGAAVVAVDACDALLDHFAAAKAASHTTAGARRAGEVVYAYFANRATTDTAAEALETIRDRLSA